MNRHERRRARARKIVLASSLALSLQNGPVYAQSSPGLQFGQVPSAGQWNSYFAAKQDWPLHLPACGVLQWVPGTGIQCNTVPAAASAASVATTDNTTSNATYYPTFTTAINGTNPLQTDSSCLTYNPAPGVITVCGIAGLTGLAGTAALLFNTSSVLLTNSVSGALEYDGTAFYGTPGVNPGRGLLPTEAICILSGNYTLTNGTGAQQSLNCSANGQVLVLANTTYNFEATYYITNTGTVSHTWSVGFLGSAVPSTINYSALAYTTGTGASVTPLNAIAISTPAVTVITAASTTATESVLVKIDGTVRVGVTGGSFQPAVKLSAAPGGVQTMGTNSTFRIHPIGSNVVTKVGTWN